MSVQDGHRLSVFNDNDAPKSKIDTDQYFARRDEWRIQHRLIALVNMYSALLKDLAKARCWLCVAHIYTFNYKAVNLIHFAFHWIAEPQSSAFPFCTHIPRYTTTKSIFVALFVFTHS